MAETTKINKYADKFLSRIMSCVLDEIKWFPRYSSAIVESVNEDGTVNVYFPPNKDKIFNKISNQTPFTLQAGDGVELILKDGSYNNCWVAAKHGATFKNS